MPVHRIIAVALPDLPEVLILPADHQAAATVADIPPLRPEAAEEVVVKQQ